jgi:hypothetical protein
VPIWAYRALLALSNPCPECGHRRTQAQVGITLGATREWTNKLIQRAKPAVLHEIERKEKEAKLEASLDATREGSGATLKADSSLGN